MISDRLEFRGLAGLIERALAEDVGTGDVTVAATVPARTVGKAHIRAKQELVCAGLPLAERVFRSLDVEMDVEFRVKDGDLVRNGQECCWRSPGTAGQSLRANVLR